MPRFHLLAVLIPAVLTACSAQPPDQQTTPVAPSFAAADAVTLPGAFYPISVGNQWTFRRVVSLSVIPDAGEPPPPEVTVDQMSRRQTMIYGEGDAQYILEQDYIGPYPGLARLYRQDRSGLYEGILYAPPSKTTAGPQLLGKALSARAGADPSCLEALLRRHAEVMGLVNGAVPPGDGLRPGEFLRLAYPLHEGATWVVADSPLLVSTVEGVDLIAGSPAYRIRFENELIGPDDQVYLWFGRCGSVAVYMRLEAVATDETGNRIGTAVSEETWDLQSVDIDRGGCEVGSDNGVVGGNFNAYPLAVGNRWTYRIEYRQPLGWFATVVIADQEQVSTADVDGRTYIKEVVTARAPAGWTSVSYLRQDPKGLYRLDRPAFAVRSKHETVRAVAWAAVGGGPGEATELVYPLQVGRAWTIRDDAVLGLWTATVEARERLSLPVGEYDAFRIRIERNTAPSGSELFVWYGSAGVLRVLALTQTIDGISSEEWTLQELELTR